MSRSAAPSIAIPDLSAPADPAAGTEPTAGPIQRSIPPKGPVVSTFAGQPHAALRPPDPTGEAGPTYFVQAINGLSGATVAVYLKTNGVKVSGPWNMGSLWDPADPCATQPWGDPIVQYDQLADRWVLSQGGGLSGPPFYQCVAVSQTGDPAGAYYAYSVNTGNRFGDYPKLSVFGNSYYVTVRTFLDGATFDGPSVWALDRIAMLNGGAAQTVRLDLTDAYAEAMTADEEGPLPPNTDGAPVVAIDDVTDLISVWSWKWDWTNQGAAELVGPVAYPVNPFTSHFCEDDRRCLGQPGTAQTLDSLARHLMYRLAYRSFGATEMMAFTHTVDADTTKTKFRWYTFSRNAGDTDWTLTDQGTFAPDATNRWTPSVAIDQNGGLGIVYNIVDATSVYPGVAITGRPFGDPPGSLSAGETVATVGQSSQITSPSSAHRWGDYNHISVDPADDCTFWFTAEYMGLANEWQTVIGRFTLPSCGTKEASQVRIKVRGNYGRQGSTLLFHPKDKVKVTAIVSPPAPFQSGEIMFWRMRGSGPVPVLGTEVRADYASVLRLAPRAGALGKKGRFQVGALYYGDQDTSAGQSPWVVFRVVRQ